MQNIRSRRKNVRIRRPMDTVCNALGSGLSHTGRKRKSHVWLYYACTFPPPAVRPSMRSLINADWNSRNVVHKRGFSQTNYRRPVESSSRISSAGKADDRRRPSTRLRSKSHGTPNHIDNSSGAVKRLRGAFGTDGAFAHTRTHPRRCVIIRPLHVTEIDSVRTDPAQVCAASHNKRAISP